MKKLFHTLLAVGLLFGITSCGGQATKFYTVSYETEHGTAPETISVKDGDILTADQLKAIEAEGFTFKGWFDGETEAKADEYVVTKDVTLTAKWEVATKYYTVTFETSIGTKPDALKVAENTILKAEQLPALKDSDGKNNFKGWFDGETEAKADEYKVTKDVTLTAKWETAFTLLKSWDYTIVEVDANTGTEMKTPTRITFVDDKNFLGTVVFDMEAMTGEDPLFCTVKGTYTNTNGKIALTFDETQLSLVNGAAWMPVSEDTLESMENVIDLLKSFEIKVENDKLLLKDGENFIDYKEAALIDEKMIGAWEIDEDFGYRLQFESDNTLYTAKIDEQTKEKEYSKGKYVIIDGYLLGYFTEISSDFETWSKMEEDDINNSMMTIKYSFNGDKLYVGSDYSKMSTPNIKY